MSLETIMRASLEKSSSLSENEIFKLNYKTISKLQEAYTLALHKMQEQLKTSYSTDGSSTYEEVERRDDASKKDRAENLKKLEPCKLSGEPLVKEYYEFGKKYLNKKIQYYETAIKNLNDSKKGEYGEFSKHNPAYRDLNNDARKKIFNTIYDQKKTTFNKELENAKKQQALWLGKKTFTQSVEKNGKLKQEETSFPEEELHFRDRVLNYNPNLASENKTINVYQDGVHLVSNKKTEDTQPPSIQISNTRASFKNCIPKQIASSSNFYSIPSVPNEKKENRKLPVDMFFGS